MLMKGTVDSIQVEESSGSGILDEAAKKSVKKWKFQPAKIAGVPVKSKVKVPMTFVRPKS